jgi:hypothetical protein
MDEFFARMYEWFGLIPVYSKDLCEFLRGWDYACTGYFALHWYLYVGLFMVVITTLLFALQYDLISGKRFKRQRHWALTAFVIIVVNFAVAFTVPFVALETGVHCMHLKLAVLDCIGFGLSNAVWAFIFFSLLSLGQEALGKIIKS